MLKIEINREMEDWGKSNNFHDNSIIKEISNGENTNKRKIFFTKFKRLSQVLLQAVKEK